MAKKEKPEKAKKTEKPRKTEKPEKPETKDRLYNQYHPAFCSAMELELREDRDHLCFQREYNLNSKPNVVDLLIISQDDNRSIKSKLGAIFRKYNLCEYKRPTDDLDDITYYRTMGYAYLSVAYIKEVNSIDEVTVSFIRDAYPRKLIEWLAEREFRVTRYDRGIYHVTRDYHVDMQIIVTRQLGKEYKWINKLTAKLEADDFIEMKEELQGYNDKMDIINAESVIDLGVSLSKNKKSIRELIGMGWFIEEREKLRKAEEKNRKAEEKNRKDAEDIKAQKILLAEREAKMREREELIAAREQKLKELIS